MKVAVSAKGKEIVATSEAPEQALCPICRHTVGLRKRRLMNGDGYVFYWRQMHGGKLSCRARSRAVSRSRQTE